MRKIKSKIYYCLALFLSAGGAISLAAAPVMAFADADWASTQTAGSEALDTNKYWLAEPLLKKSVSEAELFGFNDLRLARSLGELGRLYTIRGRFLEAQPFLERELAVRRIAADDDDGKIMPALASVVRFYLNYGTADRADGLAQDMLNVVEGKMREPRRQGEAPASRVSMKQGAPIQGWCGTAAPVARDPLLEWAIACDSVAAAYQAHGNFKLAERLFKAALDTKETVLGKGHLSLANSYDSLGSLALEKKEYEEALSYFKDALKTTEDTLSSDSPEVYGRLDKLARCYIKAKKYAEAESLYRRALTFWSNSSCKYGNDNRALYALGSLYAEQKKYAEAEPVLRQALEKAEQYSGPCSLSLVPYLERYAYVLYYLGRRSEASQLKARAGAISGAS
jgi:tetratricopeptide (TPR) repeat protein